jgi:hypothetical protein
MPIKVLRCVDTSEAVQAARTWLSTHAGDGRLGRKDGEREDAAEVLDAAERLAMVEAIWDRAQPIMETPAEIYLRDSRRLKPTPEDAGQVRWLSEVRGYGEASEGAMVAALRDNEANLVAIQLTFIDVAGKKSSLSPARGDASRSGRLEQARRRPVHC